MILHLHDATHIMHPHHSFIWLCHQTVYSFKFEIVSEDHKCENRESPDDFLLADLDNLDTHPSRSFGRGIWTVPLCKVRRPLLLHRPSGWGLPGFSPQGRGHFNIPLQAPSAGGPQPPFSWGGKISHSPSSQTSRKRVATQPPLPWLGKKTSWPSSSKTFCPMVGLWIFLSLPHPLFLTFCSPQKGPSHS